jgi:hypothetical protein
MMTSSYFYYSCKNLLNHVFYMNSFTSHRDIAHNFWKANWINEQANRSIVLIVEIVMFVEQYNELTSHACLSAHSIVTRILKIVCNKTSK